MEIVLIGVFVYLFLSFIIGVGFAIRLSIIKKAKRKGKNIPLLEEDFVREDMCLFFSCTWLIVFIKSFIDNAVRTIGGE